MKILKAATALMAACMLTVAHLAWTGTALAAADAQLQEAAKNGPDAGKQAAAEDAGGSAVYKAAPEKKYPVTVPVDGRPDVTEFVDGKNGFRIHIPGELTLYPLGVNPVAVLRAENTAEEVRLAIDASAIDNKGPLMPFQVDSYRGDLIRMIKNSVKESANDKKITVCREEEINGQKAVHAVSSTLSADGKRRLVRDQYVFVTQNRLFVVLYMMPQAVYPRYSERIPEWMQSVTVSQVWKRIGIKGTSFATEVPASCIDLKEPSETEKKMEIYGNESVMVGLVAYPSDRFGFIPGRLDNLSQTEKQKVLEGLRQKLGTDTKNAATGYRGEFTEQGGIACVKAIYEVNGSQNESYTFVKDGSVLELGFVYKAEQEKTVRPVIAHAMEKLEL